MFHMSCVMCHVSCVMCRVSCFIFHVSCVMCHVSGVRCQVSHVLNCLSPVTCHMPLMPTATATDPTPANSPTKHSRLVRKDREKLNNFFSEGRILPPLKPKLQIL
jgi:hypothetical protein